jgi:hypothetical protein
MATWTRQPQEQEGTFLFSGLFTCTAHVKAQLTDDEIQSIYTEIQKAVKENNGLDYLQVFIDEEGRKLFLIDSMNQEAIESDLYDTSDPFVNYCTLMFANEY